MNRHEELLAQVLEECLEEDLSFVPPEGEIARKHRFSESFEARMRELQREFPQKFRKNFPKSTQEREVRRHFTPKYGYWAACMLALCVCGWLFSHISGTIGGTGANMERIDTSPAESAALDQNLKMDSAENEAADSKAAGQDAGAGMIAENTDGKEASQDMSLTQEEREYCGRTVRLAARQEVPERLENVTTLVNCPVLDENNPLLMLTIGNTGETEIRYLNRYELEVWLQDAWYRIPAESGEEGKWITLGAGMAVDEEIDLSKYRIDYDASLYRLITFVDEDALSVEFTFGEMFKKTMGEAE